MGTSTQPVAQLDARADKFIEVENALTDESDAVNKTVRRGEIKWVDEIPFSDLPEHEKARIQSELQQEQSLVVVQKPLSETTQKKVNPGKATTVESLPHDTYLKIVVEEDDGQKTDVFVPVPSRDEYSESYLDRLISMAGGGDYEITALNARRVWLVDDGYGERILTDEMADTLVWAYRHGYGQFESGEFTPTDRLEAAEKLTRCIGSSTQGLLLGSALLSALFLEVLAILLAVAACGVAVLMLVAGLEKSNSTEKGKRTVLRMLVRIHREYSGVAPYVEDLIDRIEE